MFGRKAVIPIDLDNANEHAPPDAEEIIGHGCDPEIIETIQENTRKRLEKAKENIVRAQQKQKEVYDRKHHQPDAYALGALVLKKTLQERNGREESWIQNGWALHFFCYTLMTSPIMSQIT